MGQYGNAAPQGPRRPRILGWLAGHRVSVLVVAAVLAATVAGSIVAANGGGKPPPEGVRGPTAVATTPAPEASVVAADEWLAGPADKLLGSVNVDVVSLTKALQEGKHGTAAGAGQRLAAIAKTALDGPVPPVDASLYRSALADLEKAGSDAAGGQLGAVGPLLAAGTTEITKVTAAADLVAPASAPTPVNDPP